MSEQTFGLLVILTGHINKQPEKNIYLHIKFQGEKHPFLLSVLACWGRMFMLLSCFLTL